jgi:hypothetical protein
MWLHGVLSMAKQFLATCPCGSGFEAWANYDARGIFLTYACETCQQRKLAVYRPEVLTDPDYYCDEQIEED